MSEQTKEADSDGADLWSGSPEDNAWLNSQPEVIVSAIAMAHRVVANPKTLFVGDPLILATALLSLASRLRAERPGWRTMESAPKDGTLVLLYEDCIPASVQIGRWEEDGECWAADPGGWSVEVAMWQPLPDHPALHPSVAEGRQPEDE